MFLSKRNGIYYLWYANDAGKKRKISTRCRYKADALKFLQSFKETVRAQQAHRVSLSQFTRELLPYLQSNYSPETLLIYKRALRHLNWIAGDVGLGSLTGLHFDKYKAKRLQSISPVTVNIELRSLKAAMNIAVRWEVLEKNPFEGLLLVNVPEEVPAFFTKVEFQKLNSVISERWLGDVVRFAVLTGMRRGEIVNLRWSDVDLGQRVAHIQSNPTFKTKAGKRRTVPLSEAVYEMLMLRANVSPSEYVFTLNDRPLLANWITHKLKQYVRRLGLNDNLNFHSLRHTFATWLVQEGVSIYEVQKLLGHSNISVTQVYSHLAASELHGAVNKISVSLN